MTKTTKIGILPSHLLNLLIKPSLIYVGMNSQAAQQLMLGTIAQETHLGHYLKQLKGPALGIYQIEPKTHIDIYENFLKFNQKLFEKVNILAINENYTQRTMELVTNLSYATVMARLIYYRVAESLPKYGDINAMACYWKNYFNTSEGAGTIDEFINNYYKYIEGYI